MNESLSGPQAVRRVRELLAHFRAGVLVTAGPQGTFHARPMALPEKGTEFAGDLWFLTDDRARKIEEVDQSAAATVTFQNDAESCYLALNGRAEMVRDVAMVRDLWSPLYRTWFPGGPDDPHIALLRFTVASGEYWDAPGGAVVALAGMIKAAATGAPVEVGEHGRVDLDRS